MSDLNSIYKNIGFESGECIRTERNYQERMWNVFTTSSGGMYSELEFLVFIQDCLNEAIQQASRQPEPEASNQVAASIRKICALALACAEKNDWLEDFFLHMSKSNRKTNIIESLASMQGCLSNAFNNAYRGYNFRFHLVVCFMIGVEALKHNRIFPHRKI